MSTCRSCGAVFRSWNPLRRECDACRHSRGGQASVLLATAENELEANIWRDVLTRQGIGSALRNTDPVASRWQAMPMPFSVDLLVLEKDLARARELLDIDRR